MTPIRTVLAPTDLSAPARRAVERAARLAAACRARLVLQHVVSSGALDRLRQLFGAAPADLRQRLLDEAREELRDLGAELLDRHGIDAELHLGSGAATAEIASQADALDAELLVLGARGAGRVHDLAIGSITERVLRHTARPLLVVRGSAEQAYRRLLVPVDFSARSLQSVQLARALAPQAELVLLHAYEVPFEGRLRHAGVSEAEMAALRDKARREAEAQMSALVASAGLPEALLQTLVLHGDACVHILDQAQLHGCELIVIGKRGQGALEELLLGSVTRHILAHSHGDVLVL